MVFRILKRNNPRPAATPSVTSYDPAAETARQLAASAAGASDAQDLMVRAVTVEAEGVIAITLVDPTGEELPVWEPGAHLELHLPSGLLRQYSLCGSPRNRMEYRVSVLREEGGRGGSRELHDLDLVGRSMTVAGPRNHFELVDSPKYVFIAGGIGVTPIRAMVAEVPDGSQWSLLYGGRTRSSMAFVDELIEIGGDRVTIAPQDEQGLLDLKGALAGLGADTAVYCCGPGPLIAAVEAVCAEYAPEADLHIERFTASEAAVAARAEKAATDTAFALELRRSQITTTVPADRSVLDVILDNVPDFDFSCEEGHCGSCLAKIIEGTVDHRDEVLSDSERAAQDQMYVCVSRATTDKLVLDV